MKIKVGAILLIMLATIGFSGTIAAQHVAKEDHSRRKTHGPPRSEANINHIKRHHKSKKHDLNCFRSKGMLLKPL